VIYSFAHLSGIFKRKKADTYAPLFMIESNPTSCQFTFESNKVQTCRPLRYGDILVITGNITEGWCDIHVTGETSEFCRQVLRLHSANFALGVQVKDDQVLKIIPHSITRIESLVTKEYFCPAGHLMKR
jgi:hypothetical protein